MKNNSKTTWHVGKWSTLGWVETGLKAVAFVVAYVALGQAWDNGVLSTQTPPTTLTYTILGILALGLTVAVADRLRDKEIVAMIFLLLNIVAHWGMFFALSRVENAGIFLIIFASFMLAGDIIKIIFIKTTGFTVRDYPQSALYGLTGIYVLGYIVLLFS